MTKPPTSPDATDAISSLGELSVEQLRCLRIDPDRRRLVGVPLEQISEAWTGSSNEVWIDIQASRPNKFKAFLEKLDLHPLIMEDCLDPYRSSRFSSFDTSLHFEVPVVTSDSVDHYLSVICLPRILITIRTTQVPEVDRLLESLHQQAPLNEGTKSALLYAILDALTDRFVQAAATARVKIRQMSRSMDAEPGSVDLEEVISIKRVVQDLATVAEDQLYCISALVPVDSDALRIDNQRDYYRDATRSYQAALRILHRYEARAAELQQQHTSYLQARTETRIRILTILSSICMPLTLIAGIYGMNFAQMPELRSSWGYPVTLALMFGIAIGQLWFFYKRGWFG
jgi:magnesium transporter